jgi:low temperature requirement protein LtrA
MDAGRDSPRRPARSIDSRVMPVSQSSGAHGSWRRRMSGRHPEEQNRSATPLELLFDLTFVVAVAVAAAELHHFLAEGTVGHAVLAYLIVFFAVWWAWMNFSWFASAYDTDDVPYRLLTLVQMGGVLVLAAGIPAAFEHFEFQIVVIGYVIMRLALVAQWLRAAAEHSEGRPAAIRYAIGVTVVQAAWVARLWVPGVVGWITFAALFVAELAVPVWAESSGRLTPWHRGHITERYGLFTIIVLGEVVLSSTAAVQGALSAGRASVGLLAAAAGGLLLVFGMWWSYFKHAASEQLRLSLPVALTWGYGHFVVFGSIAALGAGLQVVIDTIVHTSHVGPTFAAFTVAVPLAVFLVVLGLLNSLVDRRTPTNLGLILCTAVLVLLTPVATGVLTLPGAILVLAALLAGLLTFHLVAMHQAADVPN